MSDHDEDVTQPRVVYAPEDWRAIAQAPLPVIPGAESVQCAAIKDNGDPCKNKAMYGTMFCNFHGGSTISTQEQAKRRIDMVRSQLFSKLVAAAEEAADTYVNIMKNGKRDVDKLAAADRIFRLLGFDESVSQVPGAKEDDGELADIDSQLVGLLTSTEVQGRLASAILTTAEEVMHVTDDDGPAAGAGSARPQAPSLGAELDARSEDGVAVEAPSS